MQGGEKCDFLVRGKLWTNSILVVDKFVLLGDKLLMMRCIGSI